MIILKDHFNDNDTVIYANAVSNGCQTFSIEQLDKVCQQFDVPSNIKQDVLKAFKENQGADNINEDIFDQLIKIDNASLSNAVLLTTQNFVLFEKIIKYFDCDYEIINHRHIPDQILFNLSRNYAICMREVIARRNDLPETFVESLSKDDSWFVRKSIALRKDLTNDIIKQLSEDLDRDVRSAIARRENLTNTIIDRLSNDEESSVRLAIANRKQLPIEIIERLAKDPSIHIRKAITVFANLKNYKNMMYSRAGQFK